MTELKCNVRLESPFLKFDKKTGTYTFIAEKEYKFPPLKRKYLSASEAIQQVKKYEAGKAQLYEGEKLVTF